MDVLSDVLLSVRLTGAVFFDVDARSPFATETPSVAAIGNQVLAGAEHVISFHIVTEGTCWAEAVDGSVPPLALQAGDIVVFPAGNANIIASAPGMRGTPDPASYYRPADRSLPFSLTMTRESGADRTRFVCGFLGCDARPFNPLLDALPRICTHRCPRRAGSGSPPWSGPPSRRASARRPVGRRCWPNWRS